LSGTLSGSTIANNGILLPQGGGSAPVQSNAGGGIFFLGGTTVNLFSDTIAGNFINGSGFGGGMEILPLLNNKVSLANTIVARNTAASGPDFSGAVVSSDHDLIGIGTGSTGFSAAHGDLVGTSAAPIDPLLTPLQSNGGPTQTMALLPSSPAIDKGDNLKAQAAIDQRGFARIVHGIDIGAVEYQADLRVSIITGLAIAGQGLTYTLTVTNAGPDPAANVQLRDQLPAGATFLSFTTPTGWTGTGATSGAVTATTPTLPPGATAAFTVIVLVPAGTVPGTVLTTTATIAPATWDTAPANNTATVKTAVVLEVTSLFSIPNVTVVAGVGGWTEIVTIRYLGNSRLSGPLAMVVPGLINATLSNATGTTPGGDPYVDFLAAGATLNPGQTLTVTLKFSSPFNGSSPHLPYRILEGI
jgi:uncharacterized repeat protein (TIGR01451 family)